MLLILVPTAISFSTMSSTIAKACALRPISPGRSYLSVTLLSYKLVTFSYKTDQIAFAATAAMFPKAFVFALVFSSAYGKHR